MKEILIGKPYSGDEEVKTAVRNWYNQYLTANFTSSSNQLSFTMLGYMPSFISGNIAIEKDGNYVEN